MAEVYVARSHGAHGFEKTVAIKRILPHFAEDPAFVRMMVDEARITVLLSHPNIAQVFEFGEEGGEYFLVMEYVPGQSLSKLVKRMRAAGERMGVLEACFLVVEVLQGLHAAHTQKDPAGRPAKIIHRDVSPQNVLLSYDGHVKLIDFGIARARDRLERTEVGTIKGKLRYLAPEMIDPMRFSKTGDFDHRIDVFAAGIILFELIAGRTLFVGSGEMEVYDAILDAPIPDLCAEGACDEELMAIVRRALERRPDLRYASAEAFADELRAYLYRRDPAFTAKRVVALIERYFVEEIAEANALEEPDPGLLGDKRELNLTSTHHTPSRAERPRTGASGETQAARRTGAAKAGTAEGPLPDRSKKVAPDAVTRMVAEPWELEALADDDDEEGDPTLPGDIPDMPDAAPPGADLPAAAAKGASDTTLVSRKKAQVERAPAEPEEPVTPATRAKPASSKGGAGVWVAAGGVALLVAALVAGVLVGAGGDEESAIEVARVTSADAPAAPVAPVAPVAPAVPLLVNATPSGATVRREGSDEAPSKVPAVLMVRPGERVEVVVEAPGYASSREAIDVGDGEESPRLEVALDPLPVALELDAVPEDAKITVDGKPYARGMTAMPGRSVEIIAKHPDKKTFKERYTPSPGAPLRATLVLEEERSARPRATKSVGKGSLTVITTPYWARVTVDGKTLDDTTPVTVELKAGTHWVVVAHPPKGLVKKLKVRIKAGESERRTIHFEE